MPPSVKNQLAGLPVVSTAPFASSAPIVPNDSATLGYFTRAIYVGTAGDLTVIMQEDPTPVTFKAVPAGATLPICASVVKATGTTATNLVAMY